jgi:DNA mismatch repair protein MutS2
MKYLKNIIQESKGFRFVIDQLELYSAPGRKLLMNEAFLTEKDEINSKLDQLENIVNLYKSENNKIFNSISALLSDFRDIENTIIHLKNKTILNDIQLFEIKHFALLYSEINKFFIVLKLNSPYQKETESVISILDPDNQRIPHFYIYSAYSLELQQIRLSYNSPETDDQSKTEIRNKEEIIEEKIRINLSNKLHQFAEILSNIHNILSEFDVLMAKARLSIKCHFSKPELADDVISYKNLFNPVIKNQLEVNNKKYQSIDIQIGLYPTLITGANMGGKTVLQQSLLISQYLCQFGFYVPASNAKIIPVEEIIINHPDYEQEKEGLSSFASEISKIDEIFRQIKKGKKILALLDEPARTTNPREGSAIVNAIIDHAKGKNAVFVISTHYDDIKVDCKKLRVKGLNIKNNININSINDLMDYSLIETDETDVPKDALKIAGLLNVNPELIEKAEKYFFLSLNKIQNS